MSRPITITKEIADQIQAEFLAQIMSSKLFGGKLKYEKTFKWTDGTKAKVVFSPAAFAKMLCLVQGFESEIAWHGVVKRDDENPALFEITDILVYPQIVSGSTVNTDQEAYQTWLYKQDDDVFNNIRMQGHSHVNFSTSPSGVDTTHQEKILSQLGKNDYYIFMIWNKKNEHWINIYDMKNNTLYETDDVDVSICGGVDLEAFMKDAKEQVQKKYTTGVGTYTGSTYGAGYNPSKPKVRDASAYSYYSGYYDGWDK